MSHTAPRPTHNRHAPKTQTTSPKTPQIHAFSPKWSAFWAIPCPAPVDWRGWKAPEGPEGLAAVLVGVGGAWPDRETTRQAKPQHTRPHWCGGRRRDRRAWLRCSWALAGPGRIARQRAKPDLCTPGPTGVEGAGGTCRGAGGRRRAWPGFETRHRAKRGCLVSRAVAGPGRASRRRADRRPSPTGVEGAGGTGGHGRASRRGAERSEDA